MSSKTITFELTADSLEIAIAELEHMAKEIDEALLDTAQEVTKAGKSFAEIRLGIAEGTLGGPDEPITIQQEFSRGERTGNVYSNDEQVVYFEYGTGIVGAHAPHPGIKTGESTPPVMHWGDRTYTKYDTYEHGLAGWDYTGSDGERHHTAGMVGLAFMYDAYKDMQDVAPSMMADAMEKRGVMK